MLENEMAVEQDGFDLRQERIIAVDVGPARLHHADLGIGEVVYAPQQEIGGRDEIGVEDGDEFSFGTLKPGGERSGLETFAILTVMIGYGISEGGVTFDQLAGNFDSFIGRVVEELDIKFLARIFEFANGIEQAVNHVLFVEDRQLDGDTWQVLEAGG